MNKAEANSNLEAECAAMPSGSERNDLQLAIDVIKETESSLTKKQALSVMNDLYFDYNGWDDRSLVGESIFVISYTVDPSKPNPFEREV